MNKLLGFSVLPSTPEGTQRVPRSGKVCPVGIASLLCGRCHHYEVIMSFLGRVARYFSFCPHVRSFELF